MVVTGRWRTLALVAVAAVLAACELRAEVNITVDDDGSGIVEFAVGIDDESATLRPDLLGDLDVDRLVAEGWEVTGPVPADGFQWVRAEHTFDDPAGVEALVDAVAGDAGPFREFRITESASFTSKSTSFEGTVDFSGLGDSKVADEVAADEAAADEVIGELGDRFGAAVDDIVQVKVAVRLPGDVDSNAPTKASNGAVWRPSVTTDGPLALEATGTATRTGRVAIVVAGVVTGVVAVLAGSVRVALWRRKKVT